MRTRPKYPVIYEINTWVWLEELGQKCGRPVNLATVPPEEWDQLASLGFDAVWLMGPAWPHVLQLNAFQPGVQFLRCH
jgi:hypothetical protein